MCLDAFLPWNVASEGSIFQFSDAASVCSIFFFDNKYIWTLLNQSWAVSYPLAHKRSSMWASVVAVSAILLALSVSLVSFSTARDSVATMWENMITTKQLQCAYATWAQSTRGYKNRVVRVQYARTVLMMQFVSHALYAVPRVRVKSEVYFGLNITPRFLTVEEITGHPFSCKL